MTPTVYVYAAERTPQKWDENTLEPTEYAYEISGIEDVFLYDAPKFPDSTDGRNDAQRMVNHLNFAFEAGGNTARSAMRLALGLEK